MSRPRRLSPVRLLARLHLLALSGVLLVAAALGCASYWQAAPMPPSPLLGQRALSIEPLHFESMLVGNKPEHLYMGSKDAPSQQSFQVDKAETSRLFVDMVRARSAPLQLPDVATAPQQFTVRPFVMHWEPGFYAFFAQDATMALRIQIIDGAGSIVEQVEFQTRIVSSLFNPSSGGRMRSAGERLGEQVAAFLHARVGY